MLGGDMHGVECDSVCWEAIAMGLDVTVTCCDTLVRWLQWLDHLRCNSNILGGHNDGVGWHNNML